LAHLHDADEAAEIVVVDNDSHDDSAEWVRRLYPDVHLVELDENRGAAGRTVGVERTSAEFVAFADDDSWWGPGSLGLAEALFSASPTLGLVQARILVGPEETLDPTCELMARGQPAAPHVPFGTGAPVTGFIACGAVVRRSAYLSVGGFEPRFGVGGEEELLAIDLLDSGWTMEYFHDVVAHHWPSDVRDSSTRNSRVATNALLTSWLRRPVGHGIRMTAAYALDGLLRGSADRRSAIGSVLRATRWISRRRRRVAPEVEALLRDSDRERARSPADVLARSAGSADGEHRVDST
jgi:GT2 family glycosyltransferase